MSANGSRLPVDPALTSGREPGLEAEPVPELHEVGCPPQLRQRIEELMSRYPDKRSASIPALWAVQRRYGWCTPEGIRQAAAVMEVTPGYLEGVASFYDLFYLDPQGEHEVLVCTNITCWLRGGDGILQAFKDAVDAPKEPTASAPPPGIPGSEAEEVPPDVLVRGFECLGACDIAPMASIDQRYYGPLSGADAVSAIEALRDGGEVLPEKRLDDRVAAGGADGGDDERLGAHPLNKSQESTGAKAAADAKRRSPR
ncbi:MAG: NAD(P)H-dependent oxidoreductase subunit E [Actinomycetota bacterium]|nr:NAD(P)H-dependent oxidoreductase subunit E [Actinomycetota bacterium]